MHKLDPRALAKNPVIFVTEVVSVLVTLFFVPSLLLLPHPPWALAFALLGSAILGTLGLVPGVRVEVKEKHPFDGPLVLRVDGKDRTLGATVANQVFVQKSA